MQRCGKPIRRAFTLLEIIVVIMVIGIMSAMIIPRFSGTQLREFDLAVDRVNDVVLMFAHRVSTSTQPAALRYDSSISQFELLTKVEQEGEYFWGLDPLSEPVRLPSWLEADSITVFVDGEITDTSQWPITTTPGETRPLIEVAMNWNNHAALISLLPHAMGPTIWRDGVGEEPLMPVDLDAQGRGREEW